MHTRETVEASHDQRNHDDWLWLTALGIVYGDLGTSPLYTLQTVAQAVGGRFTPDCALVLRRENCGCGGIIALMSLVGANSLRWGARTLAGMGLRGGGGIYGDGV